MAIKKFAGDKGLIRTTSIPMRGADRKNKHFITSRQGTAAIEYGLLSGFIVVTILTGLTLAGPKFNGVFNTVASNLQIAMSD